MKMLTEEYRPYHLKDIIGQTSPKKTIGAWLRTDRIPGAVLISGEYSCGKTTLARIISRALLCDKPVEGEACGECKACGYFDKGNHPDYVEQNAGKDRGIDHMRSLSKTVMNRPRFGKKRIFVLDEAHGITKPGWEAMLKVLEEPPEHILFILVTTNPEKIPATIHSRCSAIKLKAIGVAECTKLLVTVSKGIGLGKSGIKKEHLERISQVTGAHPRNALHALDQVYTMVLDANGTNSALDVAEINNIIKEVVVADDRNTAALIVKSVFKGSPNSAVSLAMDSDDNEQLLIHICDLMKQAILRSLNPRLMDGYYKDVFEDIQIIDMATNKKFSAKEAVVNVSKCFTKLYVTCMGNDIEVKMLLPETIAEAGYLCRTYLKPFKDKEKEEKKRKAAEDTEDEPEDVKAKKAKKKKKPKAEAEEKDD